MLNLNSTNVTSATTVTMAMLQVLVDLAKANLFFEDRGQQFKGKVYDRFTYTA